MLEENTDLLRVWIRRGSAKKATQTARENNETERDPFLTVDLSKINNRSKGQYDEDYDDEDYDDEDDVESADGSETLER